MKTDDILNNQASIPVDYELKQPDHEVEMARSELYRAGKSAIELHRMLKSVSEQQGLEGWVQAKITKAADYLESVYHYLDYEMQGGEVDEAAPMVTGAPGVTPATTVAAAAPGAAATTTAPAPAQAAVAAAAAAKNKKAVQTQIQQVQAQIKQTQDSLVVQKKQLTDLQKQLSQPMMEFGSAGASVSGGVSSSNGLGKKKSQVGSLFGGTYKQTEEGETGPKFTGYWKGKDKGKPGKKMVGSS